MVRRRAAWASFESVSASLMTTTVRLFFVRVDALIWREGEEGKRTLEAPLGVEVNLLSLGDLFENLLDDASVLRRASIAGRSVFSLRTCVRKRQEANRTDLGVNSTW